MIKSCGKCKFFTKMLALTGDSGLCEFYDCRTKCDDGHKCKDFKALKYNRLKQPRTTLEEED